MAWGDIIIIQMKKNIYEINKDKDPIKATKLYKDLTATNLTLAQLYPNVRSDFKWIISRASNELIECIVNFKICYMSTDKQVKINYLNLCYKNLSRVDIILETYFGMNLGTKIKRLDLLRLQVGNELNQLIKFKQSLVGSLSKQCDSSN